jgi:phenylpropionate dioxygenase-like ring-hydroxylating dioxygenase large terminal subunit
MSTPRHVQRRRRHRQLRTQLLAQVVDEDPYFVRNEAASRIQDPRRGIELSGHNLVLWCYVEKIAAGFDQSFGMLQQENCRLGDKFARDVDCNWKFVNENLQDVYHFQTLHANTFGEHVTAESFTYDLDEKTGGVAAFYPAAPTTFDGQSRFGKMPWMEQHPMSFARMGFMVPTMNIFARVDMVIACVVWPLGPDKTRMEWHSLFPTACHDLPDFADRVKDYHDLLTLVVEEDQDMVASLQRNMGSANFMPGRMSLYETTVHNIINGYLNRMFA